jgi:hypothetical protein
MRQQFRKLLKKLSSLTKFQQFHFHDASFAWKCLAGRSNERMSKVKEKSEGE